MQKLINKEVVAFSLIPRLKKKKGGGLFREGKIKRKKNRVERSSVGRVFIDNVLKKVVTNYNFRMLEPYIYRYVYEINKSYTIMQCSLGHNLPAIGIAEFSMYFKRYLILYTS